MNLPFMRRRTPVVQAHIDRDCGLIAVPGRMEGPIERQNHGGTESWKFGLTWVRGSGAVGIAPGQITGSEMPRPVDKLGLGGRTYFAAKSTEGAKRKGNRDFRF